MDIRRFSLAIVVLTGCGDSAVSHLDASAVDAASSDAASLDASSVDASTFDPTIAAMLAGLRWEIPCASEANAWNCNVTDPADVVATLAGEPGMTYAVTLRFRGVVEGKTYIGGTTVDRFVTGGTPESDAFNVYALEVSDPAQTYYLNAGTSGVGSAFAIDYVATIPIHAGATVTLSATALDGVQHKNLDESDEPIVVGGVAPAPASYDGQFIQMNVVHVTADP